MPRPRPVALIACALVTLAGATAAARADEPQPPASHHVLLPAPDPAGAVTRGVFIDDPLGQIENLAAVDHLVAWSVRTPSDRLRTTNEDIDKPLPLKWPQHSELVVADERGGAPLAIDLGTSRVARLVALHGAGGAAEPQLAVEHCTARKLSTCTDELITLSAGAPLTIVGRSGGPAATLALTGRIDAGRRLILGKRKRKACIPAISLASADGSGRRRLRSVPTRDGSYPSCNGLVGVQLSGRYALATVSASDIDDEYDSSLDAYLVYVLDLDGGPKARWRNVGTPYRSSGGSTGYALGPAIAGDAVFWEELDFESGDSPPYDLERVPLTPGGRFTSGPPITLKTDNACAIAATPDALYELDNPRCIPFAGFGDAPGGAITRLSGAGYGLTPPKPGQG